MLQMRKLRPEREYDPRLNVGLSAGWWKAQESLEVQAQTVTCVTWANGLTSLNVSFLTCEMVARVAPLRLLEN